MEQEPANVLNLDQYLSVSDVAFALALSDSNVYELVRKGEIKASKFGRLWRVNVRDFYAYIHSKEIQPRRLRALGEV